MSEDDMLTMAQRVTSLQAMACDMRNHDNVVTAWKSWAKSAGYEDGICPAEKKFKLMVVEIEFQPSNWGSIRNLLKDTGCSEMRHFGVRGSARWWE